MNWKEVLNDFKDSFIKARELILKSLPEARRAGWKGERRGDIITHLDTQVFMIYAEWAQRHEILLVAEEKVGTTNTVQGKTCKIVAILDSIDGTVNMVSGLTFGVNLAVGQMSEGQKEFRIGDIKCVFVADYLTQKTFQWIDGESVQIVQDKRYNASESIAADVEAHCYEAPDENSYIHKYDKDAPIRQRRMLEALRSIFPEAQRRAVDTTGLRILEVVDGNLLAYADVRKATKVWDIIPSIKILLEMNGKFKALKGSLKPFSNDDIILERINGGEIFRINTEVGNEIIVTRNQDYKKLTEYFEKKPCFVVHGRAQEQALIVASHIYDKFKIPYTVLSEVEDKGLEVIFQKLMEHSNNVQFAVVIMTPDDMGKLQTDIDLKKRARQNVIFEMGFFIGRLGYENVIIINDGVEDIPSDIEGVIHTPGIDTSKAWREELNKKIAAIIKWRL